MAYVPNISNTLLNKLLHPTLVLQVCVHAKNAAKLLLQGRGNQRKSVRKHEQKLFPICAEKVQNMFKDHLTPCNAGKIPLGLEWLVHGRMAPSRYPRMATCGILEGLRMCVQHHPTIQQLASQNHRKLKFQTATFPVVAKWSFLPREEMRLNHTLNLCSMCLAVYPIHLFFTELCRHKSTNGITIVHIFRFTKRFGCKSVARGHRLFDWRWFGCLGRKDQTLPCCQKCQGSCL